MVTGPRETRWIDGDKVAWQIVAAIAHRWGIERSEPIAVWFEIDLERATGAPDGARVSRASLHGLVL